VDFLLEAEDPGHKLALMALAIVLFVVVMGGILLGVERAKKLPNAAVVAAFLGPSLLLLGLGLVYPALRTVVQSFQDERGEEFVGFDNFVTLFTDDNQVRVLTNTVMWVVAVPLLSTLFGLVYAYLVDRTRFESLAKTLIFLPLAISLVGASIIWRFVYEYRPVQGEIQQIGLANQVLVWLGFEPVQFLLTWPSNTLFLIAVLVWIQAGFAMTVLSAAIKAIPDDTLEAARLDGVSGFGMFRYITVPSIRPAMIVVLTTVAIGTLKVFDVVRTMTGGNFGTSVVANEFYTQSFTQSDRGLGAALAVMLFVLVIPIIVYNVRQMRISEEIR
jgi:alpha-glucoside transport system permease protein